MLLVLGFFSFFFLGQDEDPPFTFRAMVIKVNWPGATPLQMAKQISEPIETKLKTISTRAKITSFSRQGETTIIFAFDKLLIMFFCENLFIKKPKFPELIP